MTQRSRHMFIYNEFDMDYSTRLRKHVSRLLALMLGVVVCMAATAGGMQSDNVEKLAKYEQLKLPELVRRANANDAWAQFELGSRFNYGRNAPKNNSEALSWLRRAAQNGQRDAQRLLAVKLYNGYDIAVDHDEALLWAQRLAESGDAPGQLMLGNMYANGEGSPRDLVRAYMWYDIAATTAQQGVTDSALQQAAVEMRDKTGALLMPEEEVVAQEFASNWWLRKQGVSSLASKQKSKVASKTASKKAASKQKTTAKPKVPEKPKTPAKPEANKNQSLKP
jgi:TPR repeat protein